MDEAEKYLDRYVALVISCYKSRINNRTLKKPKPRFFIALIMVYYTAKGMYEAIQINDVFTIGLLAFAFFWFVLAFATTKEKYLVK